MIKKMRQIESKLLELDALRKSIANDLFELEQEYNDNKVRLKHAMEDILEDSNSVQ